MKEFILIVVALMLLIAFPIQGLLDAAFDSREQVFDTIVRSYAEKARLEGCFNQQIVNDMENEVCNKLSGLTPADIVETVTTDKKYRTDSYSSADLINYSVSMPLKNRFVSGYIFGNVESDSSPFKYTCKGSVTSEALPVQ